VNTNISTATEVEAKREPWPELFVAVRRLDDKSFLTWGVATPSLEDMTPNRLGDGRVFRLPSTADADRAKERERLIAAAIASVETFENSPIASYMVVVNAVKALAAFDAANAKEQSK
jgi:hypothetical protein